MTKRSLYAAGAAVLTAFALAGCGGGGGHSSAVVPTGSGSGTSASASGTGTLAFTIAVPTTATATKRMPKYVSTSTTQAAVVVTAQNGAVTNSTIACMSVCSGQLTIPAGLANVQMTLEDAAGHALSQGTTPVLIVTGQVNNVRFTLDGIVHSVSLQWVPSFVSSLLPTTVVLLVNALDADGNVITYNGAYVDANGNQVVIKLSSTDSTVNAALAAYAVSAPGAVLSVPYSGETNITVTPTVTSGTVTGSVAGATLYESSFAGAVWVSSYQSLDAFLPPYEGTPAFTQLFPQALDMVPGMAMDAAGNVYLVPNSEQGGRGIVEYAAPNYAPLSTSFLGGSIDSGNAVLYLAFSGTGMLLALNANDTITVYAPPYTGSPTATIGSVYASASNFALHAANNLYVSTSSGIAVYAPPYTGSPTKTIGNAPVTFLGVDGLGNLIAYGRAGANLDVYAPPYTGTPTSVFLSGMSGFPNSQASVAVDNYDTTGTIAFSNGTCGCFYLEVPPYSSSPTVVAAPIPATYMPLTFGNGELFAGSSVYAAPFTGIPQPILPNIGGQQVLLYTFPGLSSSSSVYVPSN